jgi:hypothetical protein
MPRSPSIKHLSISFTLQRQSTSIIKIYHISFARPNMNFEGFLNLLVKISTFASTGSEDPKSTFEYFFEKFMVPLYEQIM